MKILVAYDGTLQSKGALIHGVKKANQKGGNVLVLSVFPDEMFIDYDGGPYAKEAAGREHSLLIEDAKRLVEEEDSSAPVTFIEREGDLTKEIITCASDERVDVILAPLRYRQIVKRFPLFSSSPAGFFSADALY